MKSPNLTMEKTRHSPARFGAIIWDMNCLRILALNCALLCAAAGYAGVAAPDRDGAQGWRHAKLSGHANEDRIEHLLLGDRAAQEKFLARIGRNGRSIVSVSGGGLGEAHVPSVFGPGEMTTPKADMYVKLDDGETVTFSIKKSLAGQVYLVTIENFIKAYEGNFGPIPDVVKRGIALYWGSAADVQSVIDRFGTCRELESRKHRIVAETMRRFDKDVHDAFLKWFVRNAGNLSELCFARGGAKDPKDWAQYVWYRNELGETSVDAIFKVSDVCAAVSKEAERLTAFGEVNGGSTIQLPFGFVQWHSPQKTIPGSIQFHHKYKCVRAIVPPDKVR